MSHETMKLGRRPPKNAPALRLSTVLTGVTPLHPVAVNHFANVRDWGLYGNDRYGDCGPTSVANLRKLTTLYLTGTEQSPSQDDVLDLYRRSGNPAFNPNDPEGPGDQGVDMQTMLEAVHSGGIAGVKCDGFAKVDHTNLDELRAAVAIFGGLLLGVNLETAQQRQTSRGVWDWANSAEWGGHAVLTGSYTSAQTGSDLAVVTWAEVVGLTQAFERHQIEEAWVVIWPELRGTKAFLAGVDQAVLADDYLALTGRPFPTAGPTPAPVPAPTPTDAPDAADRAFKAAIEDWMTGRRTGENGVLEKAGKTWLASKEW